MGKIEISRSSAAWRYYAYLNDAQACIEGNEHWDDKNLNLCTFVRRIFFWTIFFGFRFVFLASLLLFLASSMVFAVYWPIAHGWVSPAKDEGLFAALLFVGSSVWGFLLLVGLMLAIVLTNDAVRSRQQNPNLLRAWLRAKKQKVCPLIEVKD